MTLGLGISARPRGQSLPVLVSGYDAPSKTASGKAPASATVTVKVDGTTAGTATADANGAWSYVFGTAPANGAAITATASVTSSALTVPVPVPVPGGTPDVVYTLTTSTEYQTILGMLDEIQFDSIEGDGGGIQEANTKGFPHYLTSSEQTRAADYAGSYEGNAPPYARFALGLYQRAWDPTGRFINRERKAGANASLKAYLDRTGTKLAVGHWSLPPYYKLNTIGGTTYDGSTITPPDRLADPAAWNAYMRNLSQGGTPNCPDKTANPSGYTSWVNSLAADYVKSLEFIHVNCGCVGAVFVQNEPTVQSTYPTTQFPNGQLLYDILAAVRLLILNSSILATYNGQPNKILYWGDEMVGQLGMGSGLARADDALFADYVGFAAHDIDAIATNADWIYTNRATHTNLANLRNSAATITRYRMESENEYFNPYVTVGDAKYLTPEQRFANTVLGAINAFVHFNAPLHSGIIHIAKDTDTALLEQIGRARIRCRAIGSPAPSDLPNLSEGAWAPNPYAYNSMMALIRHIKNNSKRVLCTFDTRVPGLEVLAIKRPDGRVALAMANRNAAPKVVQIDIGSIAFDGFGYDASTFGANLGTKMGVAQMTLLPNQAQFWEAQTAGSGATVPGQMTPPSLTAGNGSITVTRAAAPATGGSPITQYDARYSTDGTNWTIAANIGSSQAITGLTNGTAYQIQTRAVNAIGAGAWSNSASSTPAATDTTAPTITTASAQTVAENTAFSVTLAADEAVTWALNGGADVARFSLSGAVLSMAAKDYEAPTDADANNTYLVTVRATDTAGNVTDKTFTVTVTDVAEGSSTLVWTMNTDSIASGTDASGISGVTLVSGASGGMTVNGTGGLNANSTDTTGVLYTVPDLGSKNVSFEATRGANAATAAGALILLWVTDANNWVGVRDNTTAYDIVTCVNGTKNVVKSTTGVTPASGDVYRANLVKTGTNACTVEVLVNGAQKIAPFAITTVPETTKGGFIARSAVKQPYVAKNGLKFYAN